MHSLSIGQKYTFMKILENMCIAWISATYVLFLVSNGLTLKESNLVNVVFMLTIFFFDPPTGSLGDRLGHRRIYLSGLVLFGVASLVYGTGTTFVRFAVAEFIAAIGRSLMSEALEAWLRNHTSQEEFTRIRSGAREKSQYFGILPALAGSVLGALISYRIPWYLSSASFFVVAVIGTIVLRDGAEPVTFKGMKLTDIVGVDALKHEFRNISDGFQSIRVSPPLRKIIVVAVVASAAYMPLNMFWTVTMRDLGVPEYILGGFWVLIALLAGTGAGRVKRMVKVNKYSIGRDMTIIGITVGGGAGLALLFQSANSMWFVPAGAAVAGFLGHEFFRGSLEEEIISYRNKFIENRIRATINSAIGSFRTFGAAVGLIVSGAITDVLPTLWVWMIAGLMLVIVGLWYVRSKGE